jgi:lipoprotein-releasing system ATP-binding protein
MIDVSHIHKSFGTLKVLKGIDLHVDRGEIVSIVGASGAGKTTLLQIIGTLDKPDTGTIRINDVEVGKLPDREMAAFRNKHIGFVFQFHHLLPEFTALENTCIPAFIAKISRREAEESARDILQFLDLGERLHHKPAELSGGEQQRVAVARALVNNPSVILADEPSGNLDSTNARELHRLFFTLRDRYHQTFVIVTHNGEFADMADRKLQIKDGIILR